MMHPECGVMHDTIKFIKEKEPPAFIVENVHGFAEKFDSDMSPLQYFLQEVEQSGYQTCVFWTNLNKWINVGRPRCSIVSHMSCLKGSRQRRRVVVLLVAAHMYPVGAAERPASS
jgi:hypothetical protein